MIACSGVFLSLVLMFSLPASGQQDSVLHAKKTLYVSVAGISLGGVGLNYEQVLASSGYWQGGISYPDFSDPYLLPQIGMGYCRSISSRGRWCVYGGMNAALLISLNPTPKNLRDYYDSLGFYGGRYVNPVEPWIIFDLGLRVNFNRVILKFQFTPLLTYDRVYAHKPELHPWGGISLGVKLD